MPSLKQKYIYIYILWNWNFHQSKLPSYSWMFSNPENFASKPAILYSSLAFDVDDKFSAKNDTFHINHTTSNYFSSYSVTTPREYPSAMMPIFFHDPASTYPIPQNVWHSPQKLFQKSHLPNISKISSAKLEWFPEKKHVYIFFSKNPRILKFHEIRLYNLIGNNSIVLIIFSGNFLKKFFIDFYKRTSYTWKVNSLLKSAHLRLAH